MRAAGSRLRLAAVIAFAALLSCGVPVAGMYSQTDVRPDEHIDSPSEGGVPGGPETPDGAPDVPDPWPVAEPLVGWVWEYGIVNGLLSGGPTRGVVRSSNEAKAEAESGMAEVAATQNPVVVEGPLIPTFDSSRASALADAARPEPPALATPDVKIDAISPPGLGVAPPPIDLHVPAVQAGGAAASPMGVDLTPATAQRVAAVDDSGVAPSMVPGALASPPSQHELRDAHSPLESDAILAPAMASPRSLPPQGLAAVHAAAIGVAASVIAYLLQAVPGYSRITRERVLEHPGRRRIHEAVRAQRAATPSRVAGDLGLDADTVRYHLETLRRSGLLRRTETPRGPLYHPPEALVADLLPEPEPLTRDRIVEAVAYSPGLNMSELARSLGVSKRAARNHVLDLLAGGALVHRLEDGARRLYPASPAADTRDLARIGLGNG